jgi:hypothetical protein
MFRFRAKQVMLATGYYIISAAASVGGEEAAE